jgi:hypothetical protein
MGPGDRATKSPRRPGPLAAAPLVLSQSPGAVADRFPDGQLYANLRGFDPGGCALGPGAAIRAILHALSVPPDRLPIDPDAPGQPAGGQAHNDRVGQRPRQRPGPPAAARRPRLPGGDDQPHLTGLITTEGARPLALDVLTAEEAHQMLAYRLGEDRVAAEPVAVQQIIAGCAGLPLALAIVAARAVTHPAFALAALADELREARLDVLASAADGVDIRAVFSWSYAALTAQAARLFRLFGLAPGPTSPRPPLQPGRPVPGAGATPAGRAHRYPPA